MRQLITLLNFFNNDKGRHSTKYFSYYTFRTMCLKTDLEWNDYDKALTLLLNSGFLGQVSHSENFPYYGNRTITQFYIKNETANIKTTI